MSQSPACAEPGGLRTATLARHEGRHSREMIRLQCVPYAEQRAQAGTCDKSHLRDRTPFPKGSHVRMLNDPVPGERGNASGDIPALVRSSLRLRKLDRLP